VLDFDDAWLWGEPPNHGGASRDGVQIQFSLMPELAKTSEGRSVWVQVQNVAALYAKHRERNAEIVSELEPKAWGVREYTVRDLNGYRLRFAGAQDRGASVSGPATEVRIVSRVPTIAEMRALVQSVGWDRDGNSDTPPRVLESALYGAVAEAGGLAIGCAFVTGDGAGFYYIRDVIVRPEWQRRDVGTALMQAVMDYLKANAPAGALVGLFTGENLNDFYGQFGFRGPGSGLYGMTQTIR
jgi:GNAT superfamily N-acetyltransferase